MPCKHCGDNWHNLSDCFEGLYEMSEFLDKMERKARNVFQNMEYINHLVRKLTKSQLKLMTLQLDGTITKTRRELEEFCIQHLREVHEEPDTRHCIQISQSKKPEIFNQTTTPTVPFLSKISQAKPEIFNQTTQQSNPVIQADEQCPICFEQSHVLTNCGHSYCGDCILTHIGQNGINCPMCRTDIHSLETNGPINHKRANKLSRRSDEFYFKTVDKIQPVEPKKVLAKEPPVQTFEFDYSYTVGGVTYYCVYTHRVPSSNRVYNPSYLLRDENTTV